jgi:hypothetical protein
MEQIAGVAPAVFATEAHHERAKSYAYVPTSTVLQTLLDNGFGVYEAAQQRSRKEDRDPYTKHMLRLRNLDRWNKPDKIYGGVPELVMVNAHDGTAAYHLFAGFFRYLCTNGMIAGSHITHYRVRHTTSEVTRSEVLTGGMKIVSDEFEALMDRIDRMSQVMLSTEQAYEFARRALKMRYGDTLPPFSAEQLLHVRRAEDDLPDVWTRLNVIQENIIQGGFETRSTMFNRRSMVRPVERVSNVLKINRGIWDVAEELAAEVA